VRGNSGFFLFVIARSEIPLLSLRILAHYQWTGRSNLKTGSEQAPQSHLLSAISGITSSFGFSQEKMGLLRPPSAGSMTEEVSRARNDFYYE